MKIPMTLRRDFSFLRIIAPVPKFGIQMPLAVSPTGQRELNRLYPSARRDYPKKPFSPEEMTHNFAIRALKKPGVFARRPYIYLCVQHNITLVALVGFLSRVARAFGIPIRGRLGNRRCPKAAAP